MIERFVLIASDVIDKLIDITLVFLVLWIISSLVLGVWYVVVSNIFGGLVLWL